MPRNELSAFDRTQIIALWQENLSRHQIANRLNVVRSTVSRTIRCYEATAEGLERADLLLVLDERTFSRVISKATIRRRALASELRCRRPLKVPLLTARHRTARLQWAKAHQDWLLPQYRNVLFSDESRFGLVSDDIGKGFGGRYENKIG
nr:unnamed protein product [Callosobruchus chinensis]